MVGLLIGLFCLACGGKVADTYLSMAFFGSVFWMLCSLTGCIIEEVDY